jgi:hypothetical protein
MRASAHYPPLDSRLRDCETDGCAYNRTADPISRNGVDSVLEACLDNLALDSLELCSFGSGLLYTELKMIEYILFKRSISRPQSLRVNLIDPCYFNSLGGRSVTLASNKAVLRADQINSQQRLAIEQAFNLAVQGAREDFEEICAQYARESGTRIDLYFYKDWTLYDRSAHFIFAVDIDKRLIRTVREFSRTALDKHNPNSKTMLFVHGKQPNLIELDCEGRLFPRTCVAHNGKT